MVGQPAQRGRIEFRSVTGRVIAELEIAVADRAVADDQAMVILSADEAREYGEERLQLRERGRYEYLLKPAMESASKLCLLRGPGVGPSQIAPERGDRGLLEPGDYCGLFPLTLIRRGDAAGEPLARAAVEVRSLKLGYREHYRDMLSFLAEKSAQLLLDSSAPTRVRMRALWQTQPRMIEQQLEFLRYTTRSPAFRAAIDQVLRNPHRGLERQAIPRRVDRALNGDRRFARQIGRGGRRLAVPGSNPLAARLASVPERVHVSVHADWMDTPENKFAKLVLTEFRDFLAQACLTLGRWASRDSGIAARRLQREAERLRVWFDTTLARGFFPDVSLSDRLPLGSSVLQRKPGYRELLHYWLQFHAGLQLAWDGGADVFEAGARNVAILYEYWLFFHLESLFRRKFSCDVPLRSLVVDRTQFPPRLVLRRGMELATPVAGVWSGPASRRLCAEFHFNRKYSPEAELGVSGSWTRGVQPDYTISVWPAEYSRDEAEANELMVHIHFDAKYRVERLRDLLGGAPDDQEFARGSAGLATNTGVAKYSDLLKMHAYRDAVRRTAGAYVIYPGEEDKGQLYRGFHEVLPGLGAFAIRPGPGGKAHGIDHLSRFLDEVLDHLANRTTARERVTYHVAAAYQTSEPAVHYGAVRLPEADYFDRRDRALPPAEQYVLVAWYRDDKQLAWTRREGMAIVRLGRRPGAWHVQPEFAEARHLLLHSRRGVAASGLWRLRSPGYRVYTDGELKKTGYPGLAAGEIYAQFEVEPDPEWSAVTWDSRRLLRAIRNFESRIRARLVRNVGRRSAYPRILPLRDLLLASG